MDWGFHCRAALIQITRPQVQGCGHEGQLGKLRSRSLVRTGQEAVAIFPMTDTQLAGRPG